MSNFIPNSFQMPNALVDQVMPIVSPVAFCILNIIVRKTKGWNKDSDAISLSQFMKMTNKSRNTVISALKEVEKLEFISVKKAENQTTVYCFRWFKNCTSSKTEPVQKLNQCSSKTEPVGGSKIEHTKDQYKNTYQNNNSIVEQDKDSLQIEKFLDDAIDEISSVYTSQKINRSDWLKTIRLLIDKDGFTFSQIQTAWDFARRDKFWKTNCRSIKKLRERNRDGTKYIEIYCENAKHEHTHQSTASNNTSGNQKRNSRHVTAEGIRESAISVGYIPR